MKKKLLCTLAAVSMLSNVVTPVLAAKPSHEGGDHYSYATGQEGKVTEAAFLETSYTQTNGESEDYLEQLMAWVDDDTLAHELRYVEWYIENHDSNYPFSLADSKSGNVYCGFDSGSATLTAVITRDDGSLVKASTKLVAQPRQIQYATGFYFTNTSQTLYTGAASITGGDLNNTTGGNNSDVEGSFNRVQIKATPDTAVFSQEQYEAIESAINEGQMDVSLRAGTTDAFDEGYQIAPVEITRSGEKSFNGYTGHSTINVFYPIGTGSTTSTVTNGKVVFEINDATNISDYDEYIVGDVELSETVSNGGTHGSNFVTDLVKSLNASSMYSASVVSGTDDYYHALASDSIFVEITMKSADAYEYDSLMSDIARALNGGTKTATAPDGANAESNKSWSEGSGAGVSYADGVKGLRATDNANEIAYAVSYQDYTFDFGNNNAKDTFETFLKNPAENDTTDFLLRDVAGRYQGLEIDGGSASWTELAQTNQAIRVISSLSGSDGTKQQTLARFIDANASNGDSVEYVLWNNRTNSQFTTFDDGSNGDKVTDIVLRVWDADGKENSASPTLNGMNGQVVYMSTETDGFKDGLDFTKSETDIENIGNFETSKDNYFTLRTSDSKVWSHAYNYTGGTFDGVAENGTLRGFDGNYGTAAHDYELEVTNFPRYDKTRIAEYLDNVARSIRINSNVAVQPSSLHQTSAITVTVGDTMDITSHFKPTSTSNVWWDYTVDEAFFNNDSSYAYNDYGVILEDEEEVLGVRVGKNKIVATVTNTATGVNHSAEVVVTVVPRTGVSTTVTPTSTPLTVSPGTHTMQIGNTIQLVPAYFGEANYDVNDNVLPTLQSSDNGKIEDRVDYESSTPTVLSVNADTGLVTAVGVGTGTITAYVPNSDFKATATITVVAPVIPDTNDGPSEVPSTGVNTLGKLF